LKNKYTYLELLEVGLRVVDQSESSGLSSSELGAEAECLDCLLGSLVESSKTSSDLIFGEIGLGGVEDINDKLLAVEETVGDEFAGSESCSFVGLQS
jgi:hypothetical protein